MNPADFQAFISYFEENGKTFAELVKNILKEKLDINAFVAHLERPTYADDFDKVREAVIKNSKYFIFINTRDSLIRNEIIDEFKLAYPNGLKETPKLIVFFNDSYGNRTTITDFEDKMGFRLERYNQQFFKTYEDLSSVARNLFEKPIYAIGQKESRKTKNRFKLYSSVFIGRKEEIDEIKDFLKSEKIISIVGVGGIGKSSLAYKVIEESQNRFNNIAALTLSREITLELLVSSISKQLNFPFQTIEEVKDKLSTLSDVLLFVDNYEVISDYFIKSSNAPYNLRQIHDFFNNLPNSVTILITSRNKINLDIEYHYELSGLNESESLELFLTLIANRHKNMPSNDFIKSISGIIKEIQGHPLALRLLAGSYLGGGISEINSIYMNIIKNKSNLEIEDKHRSLKACFNYSFNKLSSKRRQLLKELIQFESPFTEDAFIFVFSDNFRDLNILTIIHFVREYTIKYQQNEKKVYDFHHLIRLFLKEIAEKRNQDIDNKITKYYTNYISKAYEDIEKGNAGFNKLLEIVLKTEPNDFDLAIERISDLKTKTEMYDQFGIILAKLHFTMKAMDIRKRCIELDSLLDNEEYLADDYYQLSLCFADVGDYNLSIDYGERALSLYEMQDNKNIRKIASQYLNLSNAYIQKRDFTKCKENLEKASNISRALDDPLFQVHLKNCFGNFYSSIGMPDIALRYNIECKNISESLGKQEMVAGDLRNIGYCYKLMNKFDMAEDFYKQSLYICESRNDLVGMLRAIRSLSRIPTKEGVSLYKKRILEIEREIEEKGLTYSSHEQIL